MDYKSRKIPLIWGLILALISPLFITLAGRVSFHGQNENIILCKNPFSFLFFQQVPYHSYGARDWARDWVSLRPLS
jgi:hypothetical protein